jgi:antitoxin CcdA
MRIRSKGMDCMTESGYDKSSSKKAVNLTVNADLLGRARALKINLSEALEARLAELVAADEQQRFRIEARPAIQRYNARIEEEGLLSDDHWTF